MSKYNFFSKFDVDGYDFPEEPQVSIDFHSIGISFLNKGDFIIEYSFDGSTLHGDLDPSDVSAGLVFDNRVESKIFFRSVDGYSTVRVEVWGR